MKEEEIFNSKGKHVYRIPESFFALKAVDGVYTPPLGRGNYKALMDHEWHKDPHVSPMTNVQLCKQGYHAFPLNRLYRWLGLDASNRYTAVREGKRVTRHIWLVEMSGYAQYDWEKMCASHIRFVERLSKTEVTVIRNQQQASYLDSTVVQSLKLEGLVLVGIKESRGGSNYPTYTPQLLEARPAKEEVA